MRCCSLLIYSLLAMACMLTSNAYADQPKPNILWITTEDIGPQWGCYGDAYATTPNLDEYAKKSTLYLNAWSNAPVCAPARTTIITGMYPPSLGAEHMRSMVNIPKDISLFPVYLQQAGYYCTNNSKEDYNVNQAGKTWDESSNKAHYKNRKDGQPFFAVFNSTMTHESQIRKRPHNWVHDTAKAPVPPYHPDTIECRQDWAQYYDNITEFDTQFANQIKELETAGLTQETIVFVYGDHGSGMPRSKRWPYNSGLHVPLMVFIPEKYKHLAPLDYKTGGTSDRLVSFVDLAPTVLKLAGAELPKHLQGNHFLGESNIPEQTHLHGFRGRMDERADFTRSVRNKKYVYVRNYHPQRIYGQYIDYMFQTPTTQVWKNLFDAGKATPAQAKFWQVKPAEELFELSADRYEINNLIDSPEHQAVLAELREAHKTHVLRIHDLGFLTEAEMHRRGEKLSLTFYELGKSNYYNINEIFTAADLSARYTPEFEATFKKLNVADDAALRFWSCVGLQVRGKDEVNKHAIELKSNLQDTNPSVSIYSAEALLKFSDNLELINTAQQKLLEHVHNPKSSVFDIMMALQVLEESTADPKHIAELVKANPISNKNLPKKYVEYSNRLLKKIEDDAK